MHENLIFFKSFQHEVIITLESSQYAPFIAKVKDFNYKKTAPRVLFKKYEETIFPTDSETVKPKEYMVYIKNIKKTEIHKMPTK